MGSVCQRRAPEPPSKPDKPELPTLPEKPKPFTGHVPRSQPAPKEVVAARYKTDYSKWDKFEDSDEEPVQESSTSAPPPSEIPESGNRMTRWSGKGMTLMEELKDISRRSSQEMKAQLGARPEDVPAAGTVPDDFKKNVGVITSLQLAMYNCDNDRKLVSVYGDIFEVSIRPDLYGKDGKYSFRSGRDVTWSAVTGKDNVLSCNQFYDYFKADYNHIQRFLQMISQHLVSFEDDFGSPVGQLDEYVKDYDLPPAPEDEIQECKQQ